MHCKLLHSGACVCYNERKWGVCTGCCTDARTQPDSELWLLNVNVLLNALQIIQKPSATDTGEKERGEIYSVMPAR